MEADIQAFADSIQHYTREQLLDLCVQMRRDNSALETKLKEYRASDTAMARDYQKNLEKTRDLQKQLDDLQQAFEHVRAQNELLNRYRFGSHNEKISSLHASFGEDIQDPLAEDRDPESCAKKEKVVPFPDEDRKARAYARKMAREALGGARTKKQPTKLDLSGLPHTNTYDINIRELDELFGTANWEIIGWHQKEKLHKPVSTYYVEEIHVPVVKCLDTGKLYAQPMPDVLLKGSPVTPELLAFIIYEKYFKCVPLYRLSEDMQNQGLILPRQDMSNWIVRFAHEFFAAPYYYMQRLQCARKYAQCDETTLQVLNEEGRDARTKSYVWVHVTGELDDGPPIAVFSYELTRGTDHLRKYYSGFSGVLTSDAYISYDVLAKESNGRIISSGCLMHARRKFAEALEVLELAKLSKKQIEDLPEYRALELLGRIYDAEGPLKILDAEERLRHRKEEVKPLMNEFFTMIGSFDPADPLLNDKMKEAVSYCMNQKENLCRFLKDGRIPCDNGFSENCIRLYARGRRNWLFSNTPYGAQASVMIYSLIETADLNGANPLLYTKYLLEKTGSYLDLPSKSIQLEELMPWSETYHKYEEEEKQKMIESSVPGSQEKPSYRPSMNKASTGKRLPHKAIG